jgi:alpha-glucosidase (family GH31 glycosyl hydrolase)
LIEQPIWNTWARYHADIDQQRALAYAREIIDHGYPAGRFVIDDRWQVKYGDLSFDTGRFPDARGMIDMLHEMGFSAHTWVVPFFDPASQAFQEGAERGYLVRLQEGAPRMTVWWQGIGGLLDVTNPDALAWFLQRLRHLQADSGLDGFKFDAGETCFLPADAVTFERIDPNGFTHRYIEFVGQHFPWSDVRAGWANQRSPVLFRQWDKASTWGLDNGLHSVISGALSLSLSGYPLFLPDMIGGNAYVEQPDAELMIRWAQVNALMPGMQFSLAPWDYGEACSRLCLKAVELHKELSPTIIKAIQRSATSGEPIIRPLFWIAPHDSISLDCDDEFLLGDDLLAAPVIEPGQRQRDVYLPAGQWEDHWTGQHYGGAEWIRGYDAPLEVIPLFKRLPI